MFLAVAAPGLGAHGAPCPHPPQERLQQPGSLSHGPSLPVFCSHPQQRCPCSPAVPWGGQQM